jgi:hypothetical protein
MSGTNATLIASGGGVSLPEPIVRVQHRGVNAKDHDLVWVAIPANDYAAIKDLNPTIWLYRWKSAWQEKTEGTSPSFRHNNGYRHPSNTITVANPKQRSVGGGAHNSRGGPAIQRRTEWPVPAVGANQGGYVWLGPIDLSVWWTNDGNPVAFPVNPNSRFQSGQRQRGMFADGGASPGGPSRPAGPQVMRFKFALAVDNINADKPNNYIVSALSVNVTARLWPKLRLARCCPAIPGAGDPARKVRVDVEWEGR